MLFLSVVESRPPDCLLLRKSTATAEIPCTCNCLHRFFVFPEENSLQSAVNGTQISIGWFSGTAKMTTHGSLVSVQTVAKIVIWVAIAISRVSYNFVRQCSYGSHRTGKWVNALIVRKNIIQLGKRIKRGWYLISKQLL